MKKRIGLLIALAMVLCLAGCKEKEEKSKTKRPDMDALRAAEVGSYIYFGEYEQDNDASTGKEAIEWLVLDKQDDKMLVISRFGLDCQPYNVKHEEVTWGTCSLRKWLKDTFYETAFISEEKSVIMDSALPDASVSDPVFLLSIDEVERYFADQSSRACSATPYGEELCGDVYVVNCWWWLRSPGGNASYASFVVSDGRIFSGGTDVDNATNIVRPAMWIDLKP